MKTHHRDTETRNRKEKRKTPCLRDSVVKISWEHPEQPQPDWRHSDVGGSVEQLEERLTRDRGLYWRFFYSRDPKRRTITGRKHADRN